MHTKLLVVLLSVIICGAVANAQTPKTQSTWQEEFDVSGCTFVSTGRNDYMVLEPGFQVVLESRNSKLEITVLDETKDVEGVETRVVEEKEWTNGKLVEYTRNYFSICDKTKDVYYFGEDVNMYSRGKLVGHSGTWLVGKNGGRMGMMMPAKPKPGMKYYQELSPGAAMDRAEIISLDNTLKTPAGAFTNCLKVMEGNALKPREKQFKLFAVGIGLIHYEDLYLTRYGFINEKKNN